MMLGLVAVALPVIIEWLFRRRKRLVELPTLRYLLDNKEQEKVKRQDRILLILRILGIFLLALAITRPLIRHGLLGAASKRQVVLLLDGTASASQQVGVTTAFGLSQKKAAAILRDLPAGATVSVVLLGERARIVMEHEKDLHTAASRVEALRAGSGAAPITEGLARVRELLEKGGEGRPEVYIFTDFQKYTWARDGTFAGDVGRALAELASKCEGFVVDIGGEPKFNHMLTSLRPEDWLMAVNVPVRFQTVLETWGVPPPGAPVTVTFIVDGDKKDVRDYVPSDKPSTLTFEHLFTKPGEHVVEAVLEGDDHRVDNHRILLCTVPENVPVLVLDDNAVATDLLAASVPGGTGRPGGGREPMSLDVPSAYLVRAIAPPSLPGMARVSRFAAKAAPPARLDFENLDNFGVVVLADTGALSDAMAAKLEGFVSAGGGLWVFLGPRANAYEYNKLLFKEGKGLLPCRLAGEAAAASVTNAAINLRFSEATHPALADLAGRASEEISFVRRLALEPATDARVVLSFSDGVPAMVERAFGRGRVLLFNTTVGAEWTRLPATLEWPILVQQMVAYLAGTPDKTVNLEVGDRFEEPVYVSSQHLLLRLPDGRKERLAPRPRLDRKDAWTVEFAGTQQRGLYEFVDVMPEVLPRTRFAVNQKTEEGDLSRLSRDEFTSSYGRAWRWIGPETPVEEFVARLHAVTELAPGLLWILVAVLGIESFLAARFGRRRGGAP